jgi:hypothetical protein
MNDKKINKYTIMGVVLLSFGIVLPLVLNTEDYDFFMGASAGVGIALVLRGLFYSVKK